MIEKEKDTTLRTYIASDRHEQGSDDESRSLKVVVCISYLLTTKTSQPSRVRLDAQWLMMVATGGRGESVRLSYHTFLGDCGIVSLILEESKGEIWPHLLAMRATA